MALITKLKFIAFAIALTSLAARFVFRAILG
jgi:hypothetical protein